MITIDNLIKKYGSTTALNIKSLSFDRSCIGLVGPNGAGKTTLMKAILSLIRYRGSIKINGNEHTSLHNAPTTISGILLDTLPVSMRVIDYLKSISIICDTSSEKIKKACDDSRISGYLKKRIKKLSLGMKQRVYFAAAMILDSKYMFFDEPLNGMDQETIHFFKEYVKTLKSRDKIIVLSSHNLDDLEELISKSIFIKEGQVKTVIQNIHNPVVSISSSKDVLDNLRNRFVNSSYMVNDNRLRCFGNIDMIKSFVKDNSLSVNDISTEKISLKEMYKNIML